ncbi:hypothetical protein JOD18_000210 [Gracilibacillus alcaliphilus]|nr:hypothetical protein [Gracilibacillus alcaliphilus]
MMLEVEKNSLKENTKKTINIGSVCQGILVRTSLLKDKSKAILPLAKVLYLKFFQNLIGRVLWTAVSDKMIQIWYKAHVDPLTIRR